MFAVRFAHPNAFGTLHTRRTMNRNNASLPSFVGTFRFIGGGCAMLQPEDQREEVLQSKGLSEASLRLSSGWTAEAEMPLRGTSPIRRPLSAIALLEIGEDL